MVADWKLYELILFNIVQNSFKYNKIFDGDVIITLKCKPLKKDEQGNFMKKSSSMTLIDNGDEQTYILET